MKMLLPLSLFRVRYEIASGRPYSEFDKLVLAAIAGGVHSLDDLNSEFCLPKSRLLIEALVTLSRAGWIAIEASTGGFRATAGGIRAAQADTVPPFTIIEAREASIFVDRLTGVLAPNRDMTTYWTRPDAEQSDMWPQRNRPVLPNERIDPARVRDLLPCKADWRIRWVDMPVPVNNSLWLPVELDFANSTVLNLPDRWQRTLGSQLLAATAKPKQAFRASGDAWPVAARSKSDLALFEEWLGRDDLLVTNAEHARALQHALATASNMICIASAFFSPLALNGDIREAMLKAVRRGVQLFFLWGYERDEAARATVQWLKRLRHDASSAGGNIHFNTEASGSHAKLLLHDEHDMFRAWVGSCNWLSARLDGPLCNLPLGNLSVGLRNRDLVARLLHHFQSLWSMSRRSLVSEAPRQLERAAYAMTSQVNDVTTIPSEQRPLALVRILRDDDHQGELRALLLAAKERCILYSHKVGSVAYPRLVTLPDAQVNASLNIEIRYSESLLEEAEEADLTQLIQSRHGRIDVARGCHAKLLIVDDAVIITSYNLLSTDPFGKAHAAREVGVVINSKLISDELSQIGAVSKYEKSTQAE